MQSLTLAKPLAKNLRVSSRVTIQNRRPRKYASDAERQKAFRERQAVIQVRVKPETVETFDRIASTLGYTRQEVVYALLMSGLNNNRNWQQTGIPGFRMPRYEDNPMRKKPTPAQLAARERFAEMARSGAFKRGKNPAKKTVSQKISQLTREGYPQRQAVAIALSEERKGKVKRNPAPRGFVKADDYTVEVFNKYGMKPYDAIYMQTKGGRGEPIYDLTILKHENGRYLAAHGSVIVKQEFERASDAAAFLEQWYINNRRPAALRNNPSRREGLGFEGSERERKPRVVLITNPKGREAKKQRMLNISWLTPGGAREMKSVPIDFTFTHYVGDVAEKFFVRTENGQLIVSEYATGGRIGQVPYTMRAAALNDRAAAKMYVSEVLSRIGAERFNKAVKSFPAIN